jgi:phosphoribosyl 1,2-cyclic phosphodiesterase
LQGATGGITVACSNGTTCNQTSAGAQCRTRSHISRHRTDCGTRDRAKRRANSSGTDGGLIGRLARGLVPNCLLS